MDNVDVHRITDTIGIDKRISPYFFGYGTPFGGTCFPRDTSAFIKFACDRGKQAKHLEFANEVNEDVYKASSKSVRTMIVLVLLEFLLNPTLQ